MTLASRLRATVRYFRSLSREPVSQNRYREKRRDLHAQLRRENTERLCVDAVSRALAPKAGRG